MENSTLTNQHPQIGDDSLLETSWRNGNIIAHFFKIRPYILMDIMFFSIYFGALSFVLGINIDNQKKRDQYAEWQNEAHIVAQYLEILSPFLYNAKDMIDSHIVRGTNNLAGDLEAKSVSIGATSIEIVFGENSGGIFVAITTQEHETIDTVLWPMIGNAHAVPDLTPRAREEITWMCKHQCPRGLQETTQIVSL